MFNALKAGRTRKARLNGSSALLSEAGRAGPRRLVIISAVGLSMVGLVVAVTLTGQKKPQLSFDARMKQVDALPGGLHSSPEQDALADRANTVQAENAQARGGSYTPPIAPSVLLKAAQPMPEVAEPGGVVGPVRAAPPQPHFVGAPARVYPAVVQLPAPPPDIRATPAVETTPPPAATPVAQQLNDAQQQAYDQQIKNLMSQWDSRPPRTDVVLPPDDHRSNVSAEDDSSDPPASGSRTSRRAQPVVDRPLADAGQVLIPAGRGIYAHPVLALSSDQASPAVFQADSGPIAGDRMLGSFSRQNNRLIVRINTVIHQGQPIGAEGLVIAPDTMEASVASGVDQHYLTRFALPAAAAFVQGLGQAIATTSNTTAVLSPLGGATTSTNLNIDQQLGVAAGSAAANIGSTLNAAAPKGPTITLDANVAVGIMFLSNVTYSQRQ